MFDEAKDARKYHLASLENTTSRGADAIPNLGRGSMPDDPTLGPAGKDPRAEILARMRAGYDIPEVKRHVEIYATGLQAHYAAKQRAYAGG